MDGDSASPQGGRYGGKQASRGAGARTPPSYQAELPEIAAAGRGVSRTTGTQ